MRTRRPATVAVLATTGALSALLLGGCGGGAGSAGSTDQRALAALLEYAQCVRAHGLPSFPDPIVRSDGHPDFPDSAPRVPPGAVQACRSVADRIPSEYTATAPVSSGERQALLAFARCIRTHGVPDWPDPNTLGQFPIDTRIQQEKVLVGSASRACARANPDPSGGVDVVQARP